MRTDHLGGTLADRLRAGPLERGELERLAQDLLGMLASLHADGKLHCDLNPASVRLDNDGRLHSSKIGAQRAPGRVHRDGPIGSPNYLAPEVMAGGASDVAADLFACGVLLGDAAGSDASAPVLVLIGMLTASEPDMRPASATEALALLGASATPPAPRAPLPSPAPGFRPSFDKPTSSSAPAPPQSMPVMAPVDVPTEAIQFPPAVNFPPARDVPAAVQVGAPVSVLAAYPPAPVALPRRGPRMRLRMHRPSRRVVGVLLAVPVLLAIVGAGVATSGGDDAGPTIPPPGEGSLTQQLDGLDSAIDVITK